MLSLLLLLLLVSPPNKPVIIHAEYSHNRTSIVWTQRQGDEIYFFYIERRSYVCGIEPQIVRSLDERYFSVFIQSQLIVNSRISFDNGRFVLSKMNETTWNLNEYVSRNTQLLYIYDISAVNDAGQKRSISVVITVYGFGMLTITKKNSGISSVHVYSVCMNK